MDYLSPSIQEDLATAFTLSTTALNFRSNENSKTFTVTYKAPAQLRRAGTHDVRIGVIEAAAEGMVGGRAANEVRLLIRGGSNLVDEEPPKKISSPPSEVKKEPSASVNKTEGETEEKVQFPFSIGDYLDVAPIMEAPQEVRQILWAILYFPPLFILIFAVVYMVSYKLHHRKSIKIKKVFLTSNKINILLRNMTKKPLSNIFLVVRATDLNQKEIFNRRLGPLSLGSLQEQLVDAEFSIITFKHIYVDVVYYTYETSSKVL